MKFIIREVGNPASKCADVTVVEDGTKLNLGLLDKAQRRELAGDLQAAVDYLLCGLDEEA